MEVTDRRREAEDTSDAIGSPIIEEASLFGADHMDESDVQRSHDDGGDMEEDVDLFGPNDHDTEVAVAIPLSEALQESAERAAPYARLELLKKGRPWRSDRVVLSKLSNVVGINPRPFSRDTWSEEDDESSLGTSAGLIRDETLFAFKKRRIPENLVRWRLTVLQPESNAFFVEWDDGSLQLMVSDEVLDVTEHDIEQDHTYLYERQYSGEMRHEAKFSKRLVFAPAGGVQSLTHRRMKERIHQANVKSEKAKSVRIGKGEIDRLKKGSESEASLSDRRKIDFERKKLARRYDITPDFLEEDLEEGDENTRGARNVRKEDDEELSLLESADVAEQEQDEKILRAQRDSY